MGYLAAHLFSLVGFVMAILLVARAAEQRRPTGSLFAWLFVILMVPYVGVPLYLVFGGRKLKQRGALKEKRRPRVSGASNASPSPARLARMLSASGAAPPTSGNQIELLATGEAAFAASCRLIDAAHSSVYVSTLILADDETGRAIAAALSRASARGVQVRLLIDALFKFRASRSLVGELRRAGVRIAWFMPIWNLWARRSANLRLHRKLVLVDGERVIVGGMNLAREYMGPTPFVGRWRDLALLVQGPAASDIERVFAGDWSFASGENLGEASPPPPPAAGAAEGWVQVVGSGPDVESDRIYDALLSGVFEARERIWITTPYFVPDEALLRALILAARRGVDVRIIVPRRSNHITADLAGGSGLRAIAAEGGTVRCLPNQMLHAKLVLFDSDLSLLGSANMDMRSLFLDYEIALVLTSTASSRELSDWFEALFDGCVPLEPPSRGRALLEPIARLIAPLE